MYLAKILLTLGAIGLIAACDTPSGAGASRNQAVIGAYNVQWMQGPELGLSPGDTLTPLMFIFSVAGAGAASNVSESDWQREASLLGTDVFTLKNVILAGPVYLAANGRVASCTEAAINQGLCGPQLNLSVPERAAMAAQALAAGGGCRWVGFDPVYNQAVSNNAGAASQTLHVRADC